MNSFAALSEEHRSVLLLVAVEGLSHAKAAQVLGLPTGTVMSRLSRARALPPADRRRAAGAAEGEMNEREVPIGEDDLSAWVDRRLDAARLAEVEHYLAAHPDTAARLLRQRCGRLGGAGPAVAAGAAIGGRQRARPS